MHNAVTAKENISCFSALKLNYDSINFPSKYIFNSGEAYWIVPEKNQFN
jgi:hypothetical protein